MLYGSAEMRVPIAEVLEHRVPTGIRVFALAAIDRVWAEGERSRNCMRRVGAACGFRSSRRGNTVSLAMASGAEGTRWYLRTGLTF